MHEKTGRKADSPFLGSGILQIAYKFPPVKSVGTNRNYNIYTQFKKHFGTVRVITTSNRDFLLSENLPVDEDDVTAAFTFDYRRFTRLFRKSDTNVYKVSKSGGPGRWAGKLLNSFPFNFLIGEGGLFYISAAFFSCKKLLKKNKVKYIYSSYRPYSDHCVAFLLKIFHPQLYWIADFRDLHVDPVRDAVYLPVFQRWCNRKILQRADLITTVSEGLARHLGKNDTPVLVLRNGVSELLKNFKERTDFKKFTIAYTGSVVAGHQDAACFFKALKLWITAQHISEKQLQIVYAGNTENLFKNWITEFELEAFYVNKGFLPMREAWRIQRGAHVNLLLSWASPGMTGTLCGKLNEYLAAGRPVLCLINGSRDEEFENLFDELDGSLVVYNNDEGLGKMESFLSDVHRKYCRRENIGEGNEAILELFSWEGNMDLLLGRIG